MDGNKVGLGSIIAGLLVMALLVAGVCAIAFAISFAISAGGVSGSAWALRYQ